MPYTGAQVYRWHFKLLHHCDFFTARHAFLSSATKLLYKKETSWKSIHLNIKAFIDNLLLNTLGGRTRIIKAYLILSSKTCVIYCDVLPWLRIIGNELAGQLVLP